MSEFPRRVSKSDTGDPAPVSDPDLGKNIQPEEPYQPKLAEFIALLHHETQQVIEHLAQPQLHQVSQQAPSAAFVKIERLHIEVPIRHFIQIVKISKEEIDKLPILDRTFLLRNGKSLAMRVSVVEPQVAETTKAESKLRVEFTIAAK